MAEVARALGQVQVWYETRVSYVDGVFYKLCVGFLLWGVAFAMGMYPLYARAEVFSSGALNCFSGAVFLGGGLAHLFPEALVQMLDLSAAKDRQLLLSAAGILFCVGFLSLLMLESLFSGKGHSHPTHTLLPTSEASEREHDDATGRGLELPQLSEGEPDSELGEDETDGLIGHTYKRDDADRDEDKRFVPTNPFSAVVLMLSISVHVIFESVAIGAMKHVKMLLVLVIATHKAVAAAALSSQLLNAGFRANQVASCLVFFATLTPVGILVGSLARSLADTQSYIPACLTILGASSFCYVGIIELLVPQFCHSKKLKSRNIVSVCVGFSLMAALALVEE